MSKGRPRDARGRDREERRGFLTASQPGIILDFRKNPMDDHIIDDEERLSLKRREAELLERIERLKKSMNETKALDTLVFKSKLYKETQEELRRIQDKLAGDRDPGPD
jgi:hypothetical protein